MVLSVVVVVGLVRRKYHGVLGVVVVVVLSVVVLSVVVGLLSTLKSLLVEAT